jgi:hypothetical protein
MRSVVDANVVKGYMLASPDIPLRLSADPSPLFSYDHDSVFYADDTGHILQEYRDLLGAEVADGWYFDAIVNSKLDVITARRDGTLERQLRGFGFPETRDKWYVRVALEVSRRHAGCTLISEDMHFYSPSRRECSNTERMRILTSSTGPVAAALSRCGIKVRCVSVLV